MPGAERPIGPRAATALLLVEGYCALAVEMIALRALVPVAGQSVAVTSLVVTAFLAALALGYRAGGGFEGDARERVARNLAGAAAWSAFWLSRFGVALAFEATGGIPPLAQVAVYAVAGVGPVAYLLAQAVVLLVGSAGPDTAPGKAGAAFAASTLGNVAGGLATALVVMQHVGVAGAVALVSGLLVLAALTAWARPGVRLWAASVVVAGVAGANLVVERSAYVATTAHADYAIEADAHGVRTLRVNGQNASREDGAGTGHPYIEWIEDRVYAKPPAGRPAWVLVIGAGGFTFGRGRPRHAAEIVFVDVDARLAPGGGRHVPCAHPPARALRGDGRPGVPAPPRRSVRRDRARCVRRPHGDAFAPPHAGVLRPRALAACGGRDALREPHRRTGARSAVHARRPHAPLGVRRVLDAGAGGGAPMAQPGVRVPADRARRRRDGVLGRESARGYRRRADRSLIGAGANGAAAPAGRVGDARLRLGDR